MVLGEYLWTSPTSIGFGAALSVLAVLTNSVWIMCIDIFVWVFLLLFFRGYSAIAIDHTKIVSPCDGRVMSIDRANGHTTIKMLLHLFDKHVQCAPCSGTVVRQSYKPGSFHPVYLFEKTEFNERLETVIDSPTFGPVTVVQVAGQVAQRIVSFVKTDQNVKQGDPIGLIKFSSRCDLIVPDSPGLSVAVGQNVSIGQIIFRSDPLDFSCSVKVK